MGLWLLRAGIQCVEFDRFARGMQCGWTDNGTVLVKNNTKLAWMWDRFYAHSVNPPELPDLDFEQTMLVCVFRGEFGTWGYSTEIKRIVEASDGHNTFMRVHVLNENPRRGSMVRQEFSQPFDIVEIPRTERPFRFKRRERRRWR